MEVRRNFFKWCKFENRILTDGSSKIGVQTIEIQAMETDAT